MKFVLKTNFIISIKKLYLLALLILIASDIFNATPYRADLDYVFIPVSLTVAISVMAPKKEIDVSYAFIFAMMVFAFFSTISSDVVSFKTGHIKYYIFVISYLLISIVSLDVEDVRKIINLYVFISLIASLLVIINYFLKINLNFQNRVILKMFGIEKDPNYVGAFVSPGVVFSFYKFIYGNQIKRYYSFVFSIICLLAVYFTGSRAALLSCFISTAICLIFIDRSNISIKKRIAYILLIVCAFAGAYYFLRNSTLFNRLTDVSEYSDNIRLVIWGYALKGFLNRPLIGNGLYSASYYSQQYVRWVTHNSFIDILVGQGIIGLTLVILTFISFIRSINRGPLFIFNLLIIFFLPYFFLNGYETLSFWLPMILIKQISDVCKEHDYIEIL